MKNKWKESVSDCRLALISGLLRREGLFQPIRYSQTGGILVSRRSLRLYHALLNSPIEQVDE